MRYIGAGAGAVLAAIFALAGCASTTAHPAANTHSAAAAAASSPPSCSSQVQTWAHAGGGLSDLHAVKGDTTRIGKGTVRLGRALQSNAGMPAAEGYLLGAATALVSDARAATLNPPPVCADRGDYVGAMSDYEQAGSNLQTAVQDIMTGDYTSAVPSLSAGVRELNRGNARLAVATAALPAG
jgi:hypothetical protein